MVALFATALEHLHDVDIRRPRGPAGARAPPGIELPVVDLSGLDADAALAIALDLGRRVGLLPSSLELAELRRLFERFQANRRSLSTYGPHPYGGELHLFRAIDHHGDRGARPGLGRAAERGPEDLRRPGRPPLDPAQEVGELAGRLRELYSVEEGARVFPRGEFQYERPG